VAIDDAAVHRYVRGVSDESCVSLVEGVVKGLRDRPTGVLTSVLAACLNQLPDDELTDLLAAAVLTSGRGPDPTRQRAVRTALDKLHAISEKEARDVVQEVTSPSPSTVSSRP
jgi:hypothetical protein